MDNLRISIGGDHAGYDLKEKVKQHLASRGITSVNDHGPHSGDSVDYPDFAHPVCRDVIDGDADLAILICGSGNGVAMTANKYTGIRCGLCWTAELAALTRQHNNANALALPARFIEEDLGLEIIDAFLDHSFDGGRHKRRVDKISPTVTYTC